MTSTMNTQRPAAWMLSFALHALVAVLIVVITYTSNLELKEPPRILELVAGEGDNYAAKEAPAGSEPSVEFAPPIEPAPRPAPLQETTPITPAPPPPMPEPVKTPPPAQPQASPAPNFADLIEVQVQIAERKAKLAIARERAAEQKRRAAEEKRRADAEKKRLAAEKKRIEQAPKPMTKADFDKLNKTKTSAPVKRAPPKVAKLDPAALKRGVLDGSEKTRVGAGGPALTSNNENVLAAYFALFKQRLRAQFEPPPGLSDSLKVEIEVRSNANGSLSGARVTRSSGSGEFDSAVLAALRQMRMPERPDGRGESLKFVFTMRERDGG